MDSIILTHKFAQEKMENPNHEGILEGDALSAFFAQENTPAPVQENIDDLNDALLPKTEEKKEVVDTPTPPTPQTSTDNKYVSKLKEYIEEGIFQDADIEVEDENGEKVKIAISSLTELTAEEFQAIKDEQKRLKDEELKEKYVSVEGLDEKTLKMIELKKAGGDLTPLLELEVEYRNAFDGVDIEDENVQESLVRQKLTNQGLHKKVIEAQIEAMKEDLTLDSEAKKIKADYDAWYDNQIEQKKQEQLERISAEKENQKEFRKAVNNALKTDLGIKSESVAKVLLDNATKIDENGLTNTDVLYFKSKEDPMLHAEISLFLQNKEEFKKYIGQKVETKVKVETTRKLLSLTPRQKSSQPQQTEDKDKNKDALKEFFNK